MNIRRAYPTEADILTDLAVESEAYWGYDKKFLDTFKTIYKISEDFIINNPTFVLEEDKIIGFYSIIESSEGVILEYFYIDPSYIRKGYGKILWDHLIEFCKNRGILELDFVASNEAMPFYEKMGAIKVGETKSLVESDRRVNRLKMVIS
ncbi:MAG TPA: GNAT family N-acetyltransferase [Soehngenia sp.]|nr:GNAT family N-acetyltransferase [Soehngenia sp.]HPP31145.1 GNAT family N-acetyltransferase [Soehngenia sp.]